MSLMTLGVLLFAAAVYFGLRTIAKAIRGAVRGAEEERRWVEELRRRDIDDRNDRKRFGLPL